MGILEWLRVSSLDICGSFRAHNTPLRVEIIPLEPDQRSDLRREAPSVLTHFSFRSVEELYAGVLIFFFV